MNPLALPPALSPDTILLLRYLLTAALLLYLPFLGIVIAGSAASLVLNFFGRENRDDGSLRLSREWVEAVTVNRWVLLPLGLLPYPAIAYACQRILGGRTSLPAIAWLVPFGALLAGCLLLSLYLSAIRRTTELPSAPFGAGTAGLLAMLSAAFLSFLLLGTLVNPAKLPLVRSNLVFILSWHSLVEFLLFLALSFGLAGGIALRLPRPVEGGRGGRGPRVRDTRPHRRDVLRTGRGAGGPCARRAVPDRTPRHGVIHGGIRHGSDRPDPGTGRIRSALPSPRERGREAGRSRYGPVRPDVPRRDPVRPGGRRQRLPGAALPHRAAGGRDRLQGRGVRGEAGGRGRGGTGKGEEGVRHRLLGLPPVRQQDRRPRLQRCRAEVQGKCRKAERRSSGTRSR